MKDLNEELLEFLEYVEDSTDYAVKHAKGNLVKSIHKRVQEVKNDVSVEVEFMTLLERDREKIEEVVKKVAEKMLRRGDSIEDIVEITELTVEQVEEIKENIKL